MSYANDISLQRVENGDHVILRALIEFMFAHGANNIIHHRQVFLLTDVHAFMCGEHVLAGVGFRAAGARAEEFARNRLACSMSLTFSA